MASKASSRGPSAGGWKLCLPRGCWQKSWAGQALAAARVQPHVVRGPAGAELAAAGGQLADEGGQVAVVRVAARLGAQERDRGVRGVVPVGVEVAGPRVEEVEPGQVGRAAG